MLQIAIDLPVGWEDCCAAEITRNENDCFSWKHLKERPSPAHIMLHAAASISGEQTQGVVVVRKSALQNAVQTLKGLVTRERAVAWPAERHCRSKACSSMPSSVAYAAT